MNYKTLILIATIVTTVLLASLGVTGQEVQESEAIAALERIQAIKTELEAANLPAQYVTDQFIAAEMAYRGQNVTKLVDQIFSIKREKDRQEFVAVLNETFTPDEIRQLLNKQQKIRHNYTAVLMHAALAEKRRNLTFEIADQITVLNKTLASLDTRKFNFTEILLAQKQIKEKFENEQLDEIPALIQKTYVRIEELQLEQTRLRAFIKSSQQNLVNLIRNNPIKIFIGLVVILLTFWIATNEIALSMLKKRIGANEDEQVLLTKLIKKAQEDYFEKGEISKSMYEIKIKKYEEKQLRLREILPVLQKNFKTRTAMRYYAFWARQ